MPEHEFTLMVRGPVEDETTLDQLFDAGCADATIRSVDGVWYLDFHREGFSFSESLRSAIRDVQSVPGTQVVQVNHE